MQPDKILDLKGLVCPSTQIKTLEALHRASPDMILKILVDNLESVESIVAAVKNAGHKVEQVKKHESIFAITVRKKDK